MAREFVHIFHYCCNAIFDGGSTNATTDFDSNASNFAWKERKKKRKKERKKRERERV
jgi:hypothetical protein